MIKYKEIILSWHCFSGYGSRFKFWPLNPWMAPIWEFLFTFGNVFFHMCPPPLILTWVLLFHNISLCVIKKTKKRRVLVPSLWNSFIPKATLILSLHSCHRQSEIWLDGFSTGFHLLLKKMLEHFYARFLCQVLYATFQWNPHHLGCHIAEKISRNNNDNNNTRSCCSYYSYHHYYC